jgi:hypothetical protein
MLLLSWVPSENCLLQWERNHKTQFPPRPTTPYPIAVKPITTQFQSSTDHSDYVVTMKTSIV